MWNKLALAATVAATVAGAAYAQQPNEVTTQPNTAVTPRVTAVTPSPQTRPIASFRTLPSNATTVTNYYKQYIYDPSDAKIGEVSDVLVSTDGKIDALIVSVGGFLGIGEKDVAVPFTSVHGTERNGKWYLTMNATKDGSEERPGLPV